MSDLATLLQQRQDLEAQIKSLQQSERQDAIAKIKELAATYGIDVTRDLGAERKSFGPKAGSAIKGKSVAAKYRDSAGNSWSGRGLKPKWMQAALAQGKKIEDFAI